MEKRYGFGLIVLAVTIAMTVAGSTQLRAQFAEGACCYEQVSQTSGKTGNADALLIMCQLTDQATCEQQLLGTYLGDNTACGNISYPSLDDCRQGGTGLPVELISFEAVVDAGEVILMWSTASESDNAGFTIEQETGTNEFAEIGFKEGHGTTIDRHDYSFVVGDLDPGTHRFRLKQTDFDGTFAFSDIVEAAVTIPDQFLIEPAYPNPFNPSASIGFAVGTEQHVDVSLLNAAGQQVKVLFGGTVPANQITQVRIDGSSLPSGTYLVRFEGTNTTASQQVTLSK